MKTLCAWCGGTIADGPDDSQVSHGICKTCESLEFPESGSSAKTAAIHVTFSRGKFDREMFTAARGMVRAAISIADPCRINRIAEILEIDPQRLRRMIDALGLSADYLAAKEAGRICTVKNLDTGEK